MGFIKLLISLPLLVAVLVFAFVNNDLATFNLWPFYIEVTVSLSVAIVFFIAFGFIWGRLLSWISNAPTRAALRKQTRRNKKLHKEQQKLAQEVEVLHVNIANMQDTEKTDAKMSFGSKIKRFFNAKKDQQNLSA